VEHEGRSESQQGRASGDGTRVKLPPAFSAPRGPEPRDVVKAFADACGAAGDVLSAHLWLEDPESSTLRMVAAAGRFKPTPEPVPTAGTTLGSAVVDQAAVLVREFETTVAGERHSVWRFAVPVGVEDIRGAAAVDIAGAAPDRRIINSVAAFHRPLLAAALCVYVAQEQSKAASAMLETARELSRIVDPKALVEVLLARAIDVAQASTGSVMLLDEDRILTIACAHGLPDEVVESARAGEGDGIAGWVLATGQPVVIEDLVAKPTGHRHDVRTAISVPIADEDGILGVLNVGAREFRARPRASVAEALEALGRAGAVSLRTARAFEASRDLYFDTLRALARAVEAHNPTAPASMERLLTVVTDVARACGLEAQDIEALRVATLMHDIGMSGVDTSAHRGERPLTTVEWGLVKVHPVIAAHALAQVPALRDVIPIVLHHHERFDGTGYVDGLAGEDIPLPARVFAVADAFVAMTSLRPYRVAMEPPEAIAVLREHAGSQFDPDVVDALVMMSGWHEAWVKVRG